MLSQPGKKIGITVIPKSIPTLRDLERGLATDDAQQLLRDLIQLHHLRSSGNRNSQAQSSSDEEEATNAARRAYDQLTRTDRFPVNAELLWQGRDEEGNPTQLDKVFHTINEYSPFPLWPNLSLKADVDSIYTINHNYESLLQALPTMTRFQMKTFMNPNTKASGSRFFVDTENMPHEININRHKAKNVPLSMFPNIEIGSIYLRGLERPMTVYLFNLNVRHIFKEHRFSKIHVAVINATFNIARKMSIKACANDQKTQDEFHDLSFIETIYGKQSRKVSNKDFNSYSTKAAAILAKHFHLALDIIAENKRDQFDFASYKIHRVMDSQQCSFSHSAMQEVARDLQEGLLFGTSVSGIKKSFSPDQYATSIGKTQEIKNKHAMQLNQNITGITEIVNTHIKEAYLKEQPNLDHRLIPTHGPDNPLTIKKLIDYRIPYEKVERFFPDFELEFYEMYKNAVKTLMVRLHSFLVSSFSVQLQRTNHIFFDIGLEIRMTNQVNVLLNLDLAFEEMEKLGSLRK